MIPRSLARALFHLRQRWWPTQKRRVERPPDSRVDASPWLRGLLDEVGDRYRLGADLSDGIQVMRRTGKERFNPMRVYLQTSHYLVIGDYDLRIRDGKSLNEGRQILDERVSRRISTLGLRPTRETVEEWGGQVITRRYAGECPDPKMAAAAVRFICEESEQIIDTSAD